MTTEIKFIAPKSIDVPKIAGDVRTFRKEFAQELAKSMEANGMLVPIAVYPSPLDPARYILVNGKHRLFGALKLLKWDLIEARVYDDIKTAEEAELRRDVEQLWHNPLTQAQHVAALQRWHKHWLANLPKTEGDKALPAATNPAEATSADAIPSNPGNESPSTDPAPADAATDTRPGTRARPKDQQEKTFDEQAAAATGASLTKIRITKALAKAFTEEQLRALEVLGTPQNDLVALSRIKDATDRGKVINLMASGKSLDDATKEICGAEVTPKRYDHKKDEEKAAKKAAKEEKAKEPEEDDETWFNKHCGDKARMLANPHKYKGDAILFRRISEYRHIFRGKIKGFIAEHKKCGVTGSFWTLVYRLIAATHPKDWLICPNCKGTGTNPVNGEQPDAQTAMKPPCTRCGSGGYLLKVEEYV